jgi:hypothetical protein
MNSTFNCFYLLFTILIHQKTSQNPCAAGLVSNAFLMKANFSVGETLRRDSVEKHRQAFWVLFSTGPYSLSRGMGLCLPK